MKKKISLLLNDLIENTRIKNFDTITIVTFYKLLTKINFMSLTENNSNNIYFIQMEILNGDTELRKTWIRQIDRKQN